MTRDDILRMAREAGMDRKPADQNCRVDYFDVVTDSELERFAALVAAEVHKACEKACKDEMIDEEQCNDDVAYNAGCNDCAAAIRARGTK